MSITWRGLYCLFFFFKQKTAYEMRISDWSSDVCSSDLLSATGGFAGFAGDIGKNTIFGAIINAVKSDTTSNLLATPHIVTLDNQPAKFLVGQEVPITTGEALSDNFDEAFRTVQREEVGIKLDVTPQVNGAGEVKLEIGRAHV